MKLQTQLLTGYVLVFLLMFIIAGATYRGLNSLANPKNSVAHTHKVIAEANHMQKILVDMETGLRGFLITGDEEFLEPYNAGVDAYHEEMDIIKNLISDYHSQLRILEKIDHLVTRWQKTLAEPAIDLRRKVIKGSVDSLFLENTLSKGVGKGILDEMRGVMDIMTQNFQIDGNEKGASLTLSIAKSMVDQETGQRGFLITGKDEFLEPYNSGKINLGANITALRKLVANAHNRILTEHNLNELLKLEEKWTTKAGLREIEMRREVNNNKRTMTDLQNTLRKKVGKNTLDQIREILSSQDEMFKRAENEKARSLLAHIAKAIVDQETGQRGFIITGEEEFLEPYNSGKRYFIHFINKLRELNANAYDIEVMKRDISRLESLGEQWMQKAAIPEIDLRRQMNKSIYSIKDIQRLIRTGTGKKIMDQLRDRINVFIDVEEQLLEGRLQSNQDTVQTTTFILVFGTLTALVFGVAGMLFNNKNILRQVGGEPGEIAKMTQQIAEGDLDTESLSHTFETGIAASISRMAEKLKENQDKSNIQDWIKSGLNGLSESMQGELDIIRIADNVIQYLSEYLNAQIGALYIIDSNKESLQLMGSYAFTKRKETNEQIEIGQGLVGEAARTKKLISITSLPDNYTRISSAIGNALPVNSVVIPLIHEEEITGVIELGFFKEASDTKLDFLNSAKNNIAVGINSALSRSELTEALETTQLQSEELQSQQGKLEEVNANLIEQANLLKSSEEELKQQSEELHVSNEELEEKQELLERKNTDVERAKNEIEIKAEELRLASKYKSEFLANMSHELRTPLNSLLILSKSLADNKNGNLNEIEVEDAKIINEGGNDLLHLINDIMDLSKVEAGMLSIISEDVTISSITRNLNKMFIPVAKNNEIDFSITVDDDVPEYITSDGLRLEQILKNFLSNAMKFTVKGSVTLSISRPPNDISFRHSKLSSDAALAFNVIDTGIGIPKNKQQAIFEAFQQQDGSTNRKYGGTGLGLTISRELSHLLGGEIQLISKENEGSTFTLYLPIILDQQSLIQSIPLPEEVFYPKEIPEEEEVQETPNQIVNTTPELYLADDRNDLYDGDMTLLIIDDDPTFARIIYNHCKSNGFKCIVAGDGRTGLMYAKEYDPTAIILDLGLPDISGHEVLEQLKFSLKTRHIPVQVISAYDRDLNNPNIQSTIGYLTKPIAEEDLNSALHTIKDLIHSDAKNILLIEDDDISRHAVIKVIGNENINITSVETGEEGVKEILSNKYNCVILDLGLPDMSGFDVLDSVYDKESIPPVIIYTGKDITDDEYKKLSKYSSDIVIKGHNSADRLLDDVTLFLHTVESKLPQDSKETMRMLHNEDAMLEGRKVLLVDDDMRNTYALSKKLMELGLEVDMANNGQDAIDKLTVDSSYELILMDIMMPIMDGYEAIRYIRKMQTYGDVPIIALTAKAMPEDRRECIEAGASEYLMKPIDFDRLLSLMRVWLFKNI